jgi:NitT/TauT family transport system ATP-binding protein
VDGISIRGVSQAFGAVGDERRVVALEDATLDIPAGELVCLIGPSGCGKSSLLDIIAGLAKPVAGTVTIDGEPVRGPLPKRVSFVFQENALFPWLTVYDNILAGLDFQGAPKDERRQRADDALNAVGLEAFRDHYPRQLSGGMKQRAQLARALALQTEILLMDEPFAALDEQTRLLLGEKLLEIWERLQQTTLLITHSIAEAVQLSDRVVVLSYRPGRIKQVVEIDLPRPRTADVLAGERFAHLVALIWNDLRAEAARGMATEELI